MSSSVSVQLTTAIDGIQYAIYEINHRIVSASATGCVINMPGHNLAVGNVCDVRGHGAGTTTYKIATATVTDVSGNVVTLENGVSDFPSPPSANTVVQVFKTPVAICDLDVVSDLIRHIHYREWMAWMPLTVFPFVGTSDDLGAVDWDAVTEIPEWASWSGGESMQPYNWFWAGVHYKEQETIPGSNEETPENNPWLYAWSVNPTIYPVESYANLFGPGIGTMPNMDGVPTHIRNVVWYILGMCCQIISVMARCSLRHTADKVYSVHRTDVSYQYWADGELTLRLVSPWGWHKEGGLYDSENWGDIPAHVYKVCDIVALNGIGEFEITEVGGRVDPDDLTIIYVDCPEEPEADILHIELATAAIKTHYLRAIGFEWVPVPIVQYSVPGSITTLVSETEAVIYAPGHGLEVGDTCHISWMDSFCGVSNGYVLTRNGDRDAVLVTNLPSGYVFRAGDVVNVLIDDGSLDKIYAMDVFQVAGQLLWLKTGIVSSVVLPPAGEETGKVIVTLCQDDNQTPHILYGHPYRIGMTVTGISEDGRTITVSGGIGGNTFHKYMNPTDPGSPFSKLTVQLRTFTSNPVMQETPTTPLEHGNVTPGYEYTRAAWIHPHDPVDIASLETPVAPLYFPAAMQHHNGLWRPVAPDGAEDEYEQSCPHDSPIAGEPCNGSRMYDVGTWGGRGYPAGTTTGRSMFYACHIILTHLTRMIVGCGIPGDPFQDSFIAIRNPGLERYFGTNGLIHIEAHEYPDTFGARPLGIWPEVT